MVDVVIKNQVISREWYREGRDSVSCVPLRTDSEV